MWNGRPQRIGRVLVVCSLWILGPFQFSRAQSSTVTPGPSTARASCKALQQAEIPSSAIGLPTTGARVWYAKLHHQGSVEYCKVLGGIGPVDAQAQDIRFEVNLPTLWNGKAVHFGGAVFDGTLGYSNGLKQPTIGLKSGPTPLQRGYATFGSDSGHHQHHLLLPDVINVLNGSFGANAEERKNLATMP